MIKLSLLFIFFIADCFTILNAMQNTKVNSLTFLAYKKVATEIASLPNYERESYQAAVAQNLAQFAQEFLLTSPLLKNKYEIIEKSLGRPQIGLALAVLLNEPSLIDEFIMLGADPNILLKDGTSLLMLALSNKHIPCLQKLLAYPHINLNYIRKDGVSDLYAAALSGTPHIADTLIRAKLQALGKPDTLENRARIVNTRISEHEGTMLHIAATRGYFLLVKELIRWGAQTTIKMKDGGLPVHCAISHGHGDIFRVLFAQNPELLNKQLPDGNTPLLIAASFGHADIVAFLLQQPEIAVDTITNENEIVTTLCAQEDKNIEAMRLLIGTPHIPLIRKFDNVTPLIIALYNDARVMADLLIERLPKLALINTATALSPLHVAASKGNRQAVEKILKIEGVDCNKKDNKDNTPLMCAAESTDNETFDELLQQNSIAYNDKNKKNITALHVAVQHNFEHGVRRLLALKDIEINAQTNNGTTPLLLAAHVGNETIMRLLCSDPRIEINKARNDGMTALQMATQNNHEACVQILIEAGADANIPLRDPRIMGHTALHAAVKSKNPSIVRSILQARGIHVNATLNNGITALHFAVTLDDIPIEIVKILLNTPGINKHPRMEDGNRPLHGAAMKNNVEALRLLLAIEDLDLNPRLGPAELTPLHMAVMGNAAQAVELLIADTRTNRSIRTADDYSALDLAYSKGNRRIIRMLTS